MAVTKPGTLPNEDTLAQKRERSYNEFKRKAHARLLYKRLQIQDGKKFDDMTIQSDEEMEDESHRLAWEFANEMHPLVKGRAADLPLDLPKPEVQDLLWIERQRKKQKNDDLIRKQEDAQLEIGVQKPAMIGNKIDIERGWKFVEDVRRDVMNEKDAPPFQAKNMQSGLAAPIPVRKDDEGNNLNSRVSSGWAADVSGVSPRQSLIDQAVADDKMKRGRNEMTSSQRKMVDNPVDPNRPNINYQALGAGPSEDTIAWAQARLNERQGDTTPEERRAAYEYNFPNAKENFRRGQENAKQAKARKDDDIALFRLQRRGLENSSHGDTIRKRIANRDKEFGSGSHETIVADAKRVGEYAKSVAMTLPNATAASGDAAAAQAAELYFAENEWKIGNETGRRPLLRGRDKSEMKSPWSLETERNRFRQQNQNSRQRNAEFQAVRNTEPVSTPAGTVPNRNAAVFSMQQKLEELYKDDRNRQQKVDETFRNEFPPKRLAGNGSTNDSDDNTVPVPKYDPSNTKPTDMWQVDPSRTRSTGYGQARVLPERLYPINPNSKNEDDLNAYAKGQRYRAPTPRIRQAPIPIVPPNTVPLKPNGRST